MPFFTPLFSIFLKHAQPLFYRNVSFHSIFAFLNKITVVFKTVCPRFLRHISATLVLSAFLTACGGGGGGGSSNTPAPTVPSPSLSLAVSSSALTVSEDFSPALRIATVTNATGIRVSQSTTGVVSVSTSVLEVSISSIRNASGRTTLTIVASNSSGSTTAQVVVTVNAVNDPPTLVVSSNSISTLGGFSPITINTTASDIEDANLTFTVAESTTGVVRVTTSTNAIVLNNIPNASGQTTLTITTVDSSGTTVTQTISVNVTVTAGAAPVLMISNNRISVQEDFGSVVIRTTATDSDSTTLTLTVTPSMRLVNVAISTRTNDLSTITLTAIANLNGTATLTFRATDDGGQTNSTEIVVVVAAVNDTPTITVPAATLTVLEDFDGTNSVATFADVDKGDSLTVTVTESSTGIVTVTTSASGVSVAAIKNRNGRTTLNISVSDGTVSSTTQIVVDVTPVNDPPALSVSTSALTLAEDFGSFLIAKTRTDIDSTTLTLTVAESATGVVTVQTSTSGVSVSSIGQRSGRTTLTITLSDSQLSTTTQVVIDVTAVNDPPTLTVSPTALTLNEDFATTEVITVSRSDIDSNTLTLTVAESATGVVTVTTIDAGVQVVSIANANGQTTLTITVSDSQASASTQVVVTVNAVNDPPTLTVSSNSISTVGGFSAITINTTASDIEDDNISFSVINADTGVVRITTSSNAIMLNSMPGASGQTTLTVRVVDSSGAAVTEIITVSVAITPSAAPVVTVSTNLISLQEDFGTSIIVQTTATDGDAADTISVSVSASMPIVTAVISTPVNGQSTITNSITLTAIGDANGTATLTVVASDSGGQSHSTEIVVVLSPVQDTPTINIPTATLTVTEDFGSTQTIATASDADGDTLLINVVESTTGIVTVTTTASGVSVSSIGNANGQTTLTIIVNDGNQDTTAQVVVTVTPVNDPPALSVSTSALTLTEDFATTEVITVNRSDIDSNTLTLTVSESSSGVVTVTTTDAGVQVSNITNANGRTTLTVRVTDTDGGLASTDIVVVVNAVEDTPTLSFSTTNITAPAGFSAITINTTANDADEGALSFAVQASTANVVRVTTSANAIVLNAIAGASGRTTLTVRTTDNTGRTAMQTIAVNVLVVVSATPVLTVSTNLISLDENFSSPVVIRTTATDTDGIALMISISSSSRLVDAILSTPVSGVSPITNRITLTALTDLSGTTTLTVQAINGVGISTTEQIVVVVNAVDDGIPFSLSNAIVSLSVPGSQLDRIVTAISLSNPENKTLRTQIGVTASGDNIFSANPAPVVSFTTNALTTSATLTSAASTAQLYFTIRPDRTGTGTLVVQLTDLDTSVMSRQTMVIQVNSVNVPPVIAQNRSELFNYVIYGGRIYANSVQNVRSLNPLLTEARALGGQLINFNSDEEYQFILGSAAITQNTWWGLVLPQPTFPGELSWITHDSTIVYGFASTDGLANLTVYPGQYPLRWNLGAGLRANRGGTATAINGTVYSNSAFLHLLQDVGDGNPRRGLYEFPQGLLKASNIQTYVAAGSVATVRLTGFDLNADAIQISDWSAVATTGTVTFNQVSQIAGIQSVDMMYTAPANFNSQSTVVVTLDVNGQNSTTALLFRVDNPPIIDLSTNAISIAEDFTNLIIGTTITDDIDGSILAFTVQASTLNALIITTSANAIRLSGAPNFNGTVTLTVRARDSARQTALTTAVITVQAVNDPPTLITSINNITLLGGFAPFTIATTATDIEEGDLPFSVQASPPGVVSITTLTKAIRVSPIMRRSGQTILTVTTIDSFNAIATQTIAISLIVLQGAPPVLTVSTNKLSLQEDFTDFVIRTTATDNDSNDLVVTVSSSTYKVDAMISTQTITLRSVANLFGTTTLTVRVTNLRGLFATTEVVVVVNSVNDTPTITVSTHTVTLGPPPSSVILSVSAMDVEDGVLPFSVSTGSSLINVTKTTTTLTITRLNLDAAQAVLTLRATDSMGDSTITTISVVPQPVLFVTTGIKTLDFAWSAVSTATHYRLRSNPDGNSGYVDLSTTGMVVSPNSTNIRQTTAQGLVSLHRYIPRVNNPQFGINTCNASSCSTSFEHNTINLTNAQLNSLIGRLQANNAATGARFGYSVSLNGDGNTLAVSANSEGTGARLSGAVYVFQRNGRDWSQQAFIKPSNSSAFLLFGSSVSLSGDGNTLAVGADQESNSATGVNGPINQGFVLASGAVYVFRRNGTDWTQQAYIKASNTGANDEFGLALSLSADGNTLAVGARFEDSTSNLINSGESNNSATNAGAVYVFRFSSSTWSQQAYIKGLNTRVGNLFGQSVSLSAVGNTLAVGATGEDSASTQVNSGGTDTNAADAGAAYVFRFSSSTWSQQAYIKASNTGAGDFFGQSVSLSADGNTLAVGAMNEDSASNQINNGETDSNATDAGAVYVFRFSSSTWSQQAYIKASNTGAGDLFGQSVNLSTNGNVLAVGANLEDSIASGIVTTEDNQSLDSGATYVYEFSNGTWTHQARIKSSDGFFAVRAEFGFSVSLSGDGGTLAVGASGLTSNTGGVYLY